ncbi:MAG: type II secretion system GspH family protein [Timaviella obliquedivisa GSE-PSE-MK23-08B]|nr:type II secretion system GspH family protein [Timaviella obliquedivisa GSE-PSE-MK23-08B]
MATSQVRLPKSSEQGLTLLECLMAVMVIGLTMAMITPPLVIAAATRVQNRQAEQAMQIAQGEVDRVRATLARENGQNLTLARLPAIATGSGNLEAVPPPARPSTSSPLKSSAETCGTNYNNGQQVAVNQGLRVDVDGDCKADFFMQTFRTEGTIRGSALTPSDFHLGVRVYSILAAKASPDPLETKPASLQIVGGEGNRRTRPLAVFYTPFSQSDQGNALCSYHQPSAQTGALSASCN